VHIYLNISQNIEKIFGNNTFGINIFENSQNVKIEMKIKKKSENESPDL